MSTDRTGAFYRLTTAITAYVDRMLEGPGHAAEVELVVSEVPRAA